MTKDHFFKFFRRLAEDNPDPQTAAKFGNADQHIPVLALGHDGCAGVVTG